MCKGPVAEESMMKKMATVATVENEVREAGGVGPSICQIKEFVFSQEHWSALERFYGGR